MTVKLTLHSQIDRWFAIWQAANPGKWFDGSIESYAETPALPFRHPQGTTKSPYWNANLAQETKTFGYTYKDALGTADEVKRNFKNLYEWSIRPGGGPVDGMIPLNVVAAQVFQYPLVDSTTNVVREVLNKGPQVAMRVVETATAAATSATAKASAPETTATGAEAPVDTKPATPGPTTSGVAFTNMPASTVDAPTKSVDESKYYRDWYVDNIVER
jgi:tyrosinase